MNKEILVLIAGGIMLLAGLWFMNKNLFKALITKLVVEAEEYFDSNSGKQKLEWVKTSVLVYIRSKNKLLGTFLSFILTDKCIEQAVDWSLRELKDVITHKEVKNVNIIKGVVSDLGKNLLESDVLGDKNLTSNEQITLEMGRIQDEVDSNGYAKAFAKYNKTEKFSVGVEAGIKF